MFKLRGYAESGPAATYVVKAVTSTEGGYGDS